MTQLSSLTLGQYVERHSIIHRLDPRTKMISIFMFMLTIITLQSLWSFICMFVFLSIVILLSDLPIMYIARSLKPLWIILTITFAFHLLLTPGDTAIYQLGFIQISMEGLWKAATITTRIALLVMSATLLTLTTTTARITNGLESMLSPLQKLKLPVQQFAFMISITLRFIPIILLEGERIRKAQSSRGVIFSQRNSLKRIFQYIPVMIPLVILSFQKAESIASAIEARGYRPGKERTSLYELKLHLRDYLTFVLVFTMSFGMMVLR